MLQELHSKLIAARNFELVAKFWDWYILLRSSGVKGRLTCYWDQDQDGWDIMHQGAFGRWQTISIDLRNRCKSADVHSLPYPWSSGEKTRDQTLSYSGWRKC